MSKRILQIIPTLDRSGAEKQLTLLARGLPRDEFDVHVAVLTRSGPLEAELVEAGIPLTLIGKRHKIDPRAYGDLKRHIKQLQPDLVQTWLFAANAYGRAAAIAAGVRQIVASERCVDPWKTRLHFAIDRYLARRSSRIVVNSPGVQDFYVQHGLPAEKFELIPNAVIPPPPSTASREEILDELKLPHATRLIGIIGRLWPQKRVKDAIWAADMVNTLRGGSVQLLVIGDGPDRDRLMRFRDQCGLQGVVTFLGLRNDVPRLLPHLDVLWSTSAFEGQSNAILEAMAAGVPVVATDIPGTRDLVVHETTGYLVPTTDRGASATTVNRPVAQAFARHTMELFDRPELALRLGETARQRVQEEFSEERMIRRYANLYRKLLG